MSVEVEGEQQLKVTEHQLKHVLKRLFDTIDIKDRGALDREEFREMLCFIKEDICSDYEHGLSEDDD